MTTTTPPPRLSWVRACVLGLLPTLLAVGVGQWLVERWRAELPSPLATHFGPDGVADGFVSLASLRWQLLLPLAVVVPLFVLTTLVLRRELTSARWGVALASGTGLFVTVLMVALVEGQRGLTTATGHRFDAGALLLAAVAGVAVAVLVAMLTPRAPRVLATTGPGADAPRLALRDGERAVWVGATGMPGWMAAPVVLLVAGLAVVPLLTRADVTTWLLALGISGAVAALLAAMVVSPLRVRIDEHGVHLQAPVTRRLLTIDTAEIVSAEVVTLRFLNSYGGFGYRVGPAGVGYIMRPGRALRIHRSSASPLTLTVDDAGQAASLLNSLVERSRAT